MIELKTRTIEREFCEKVVERLSKSYAASCVAPPEIAVKPDTWRNLYPNFKDRALAFIYSLLHRIAPKRFVTETFTPSRLTRLFPFKRETLYDDLAEIEQDVYKIKFGNRGNMLVDIKLKPAKPMKYIELDIR